jgi:pyruvate/2-oxoglutarate dehydrogenase complex dihydrolipoamide dehydrogenase (E3) component
VNERYDLVAIGGGTAAIVATLGVAGMGGRAALIEAERLGGDCLWTGCVPSKALLSAAAAAHTMRTADRYGLEPSPPTVDLRRVMASVRDAQEVIEPQDSPERLRAEGVEVIEGWGRLDGPGRVQVGDRVVHYRAALIATGSSPALPPIPGLDQVTSVYTSDTIWDLDELPGRLTVLGGGPVGCELAQAFARLGSAVTVVEALPTLLPRESAEVGEFLATRLAAEGVDVRTGVRADSVAGPAVDGDESGGTVHLDDGTDVDFDALLVAVGRRPSTSDLGLGTVGVDLDGVGNVVVDDMMRTTADRIYAAGDVTGQMPFTHVAAHEARVVVTNAMFRARRSVDYDQIPWVTFTDPEVARVGLDARAARERWGRSALVQRYDYAELDRAVTDRSREGWVELVGDPKRRLVGATIVGRAAGESIAELVAWIVAGRKVDAISTTSHAYPTFSEGQSRAADNVLRARYFGPRLRRVTQPLLRLLRRIDAP